MTPAPFDVSTTPIKVVWPDGFTCTADDQCMSAYCDQPTGKCAQPAAVGGLTVVVGQDDTRPGGNDNIVDIFGTQRARDGKMRLYHWYWDPSPATPEQSASSSYRGWESTGHREAITDFEVDAGTRAAAVVVDTNADPVQVNNQVWVFVPDRDGNLRMLMREPYTQPLLTTAAAPSRFSLGPDNGIVKGSRGLLKLNSGVSVALNKTIGVLEVFAKDQHDCLMTFRWNDGSKDNQGWASEPIKFSTTDAQGNVSCKPMSGSMAAVYDMPEGSPDKNTVRVYACDRDTKNLTEWFYDPAERGWTPCSRTCGNGCYENPNPEGTRCLVSEEGRTGWDDGTEGCTVGSQCKSGYCHTYLPGELLAGKKNHCSAAPCNSQPGQNGEYIYWNPEALFQGGEATVAAQTDCQINRDHTYKSLHPKGWTGDSAFGNPVKDKGGNFIKCSGTPAVLFNTNRAAGGVEVFAREPGTDNLITIKRGTDWGDKQTISEHPFYGDPAVILNESNHQVEVFARGKNKVYSDRYENRLSNWNKEWAVGWTGGGNFRTLPGNNPPDPAFDESPAVYNNPLRGTLEVVMPSRKPAPSGNGQTLINCSYNNGRLISPQNPGWISHCEEIHD